MMNFPQQSQPAPAKQHVCFSGDLTCSGVVPCEACFNAIRQYVLPKALMGAGLNYAGQAEGFLTAWRAAWAHLHQGISAQPEALHIVDVNGIVQALQQFLEAEHRQTLNAAPDPNLMTPEEVQQGKAAKQALFPEGTDPAPGAQPVSPDVPSFLKPEPDDDQYILGPNTDLMGPLSPEETQKIFAKAQRMTEPAQEAVTPQNPPDPVPRPADEAISSGSESKAE